MSLQCNKYLDILAATEFDQSDIVFEVSLVTMDIWINRKHVLPNKFWDFLAEINQCLILAQNQSIEYLKHAPRRPSKMNQGKFGGIGRS